MDNDGKNPSSCPTCGAGAFEKCSRNGFPGEVLPHVSRPSGEGLVWRTSGTTAKHVDMETGKTLPSPAPAPLPDPGPASTKKQIDTYEAIVGEHRDDLLDDIDGIEDIAGGPEDHLSPRHRLGPHSFSLIRPRPKRLSDSAPRSPEPAADLPLNWRVQIRCRQCETVYEVHKVITSLETLEREPQEMIVDGQERRIRLRMLLVTVPQECPECRSLRAVGGSGGAEPDVAGAAERSLPPGKPREPDSA